MLNTKLIRKLRTLLMPTPKKPRQLHLPERFTNALRLTPLPLSFRVACTRKSPLLLNSLLLRKRRTKPSRKPSLLLVTPTPPRRIAPTLRRKPPTSLRMPSRQRLSSRRKSTPALTPRLITKTRMIKQRLPRMSLPARTLHTLSSLLSTEKSKQRSTNWRKKLRPP